MENHRLNQDAQDESEPSPSELDQLNFDHHREERHRLKAKSGLAAKAVDHDLAQGFSSGSQEFGRQGYGGAYGEARYGAREWLGIETWRTPGPVAGLGPRGSQQTDGVVDATDIECGTDDGKVTTGGLVDSANMKRVAEGVGESIEDVDDVPNLRVRPLPRTGR